MDWRACLCLFMPGRLIALCTALLLFGMPTGHAAAQNEWVQTGAPVGNATAGKLIVTGDGTPLVFGVGAATVQQYHSETGAWSARGSLLGSVVATATLLASDRVLITGAPTPEVYDPASDTSTPTGPMQAPRSDATATLLASGRVLVSGGRAPNSELLSSVETFNPLTGTWTPTGPLNQARAGHASIRLPNGKVLVAGGVGVSGPLASAEIYDPAAETWTPTGAMDRPRSILKAVALQDGRILGAGVSALEIDSEIYDPASQTWSASVSIIRINDFRVTRSLSALVILQDGRPLALLQAVSCGGFGSCFTGLAQPFTFAVSGNVWNPTGPLAGGALGSLAVLPDGRALLAAAVGQLFRPDNSTPRLALSVATLDFGRTAPGSAVLRSLDLRNTGGATLNGTAAVVSGTAFTVVSGSPFTLAPGASTDLVLRLTPPALGAFTGTLLLTSNGNWAAVPLTGAAGTGVFISGHVTSSTGTGIRGISINLTGAATESTITDETGRYLFLVQPNNGYNVRPANPGLVFTPSTRSALVGTEDVDGLDFTATLDPPHLGLVRDAAWFTDLNGNRQWDGCGTDGCQGFGLPTDKPVPGDWTGTGTTNIGVFRDGLWFLDLNGNGQWNGCFQDRCPTFGVAGDDPVVGDWTSDGRDKIGVFRDGMWFLDLNGNGLWDGCGTDACFAFGIAGDVPVVGDWTGTGRARIGLFRDGQWFLDANGNGLWDGCAVDTCLGFGVAGDDPVVGDWTGTGNSKIGVFRNGVWFLDSNGNGQWDGCDVDARVGFGVPGDRPVVGFW